MTYDDDKFAADHRDYERMSKQGLIRLLAERDRKSRRLGAICMIAYVAFLVIVWRDEIIAVLGKLPAVASDG